MIGEQSRFISCPGNRTAWKRSFTVRKTDGCGGFGLWKYPSNVVAAQWFG